MLATTKLTSANRLPLNSKERATYLFKTHDGAVGILQLLGVSDDQKGLRIRYKRIVPIPPGRAQNHNEHRSTRAK